MVAALFFYLFSAIAVASAVMVISARNPVHSVLFLILCFFNAAGLFVLLDHDGDQVFHHVHGNRPDRNAPLRTLEQTFPRFTDVLRYLGHAATLPSPRRKASTDSRSRTSVPID